MKPEKQSIAIAIPNPKDPAQVLTVLRPPDDDELPNVWGLPAGSLRPGETIESAVVRVGRQKLGVTLSVDGPIALGQQERPDYTLTMTVLKAHITSGVPSLPRSHEQRNGTPKLPKPNAASGVTLYAAIRYAPVDALEEGVMKGSLCCQLYLQHDRATRQPFL